MNVWHDIPQEYITPGSFMAVIEIEKGSKMKYEMDKHTGLLVLDRVLYTSTHYPASYGFIPRTYAEDGDPLDVLVLCAYPIALRSMVKVYPIGAFDMIDDGANDAKIIAIPYGDPSYNCYNSIHDLPAHIFDEMRHFFMEYKALESKTTDVLQLLDREEAINLVRISIERYKNMFDKKNISV